MDSLIPGKFFGVNTRFLWLAHSFECFRSNYSPGNELETIDFNATTLSLNKTMNPSSRPTLLTDHLLLHLKKSKMQSKVALNLDGQVPENKESPIWSSAISQRRLQVKRGFSQLEKRTQKTDKSLTSIVYILQTMQRRDESARQSCRRLAGMNWVVFGGVV